MSMTEHAERGETEKMHFANGLRGIAAMLVVFWHFINAQGPRISGPVAWFFHPHQLFAAGSYGVALFFLISGFVIPFSFRRQTRSGFAVARFFRIWPTYAISLSCTVVALWFSSSPFPFSAWVVAIQYCLGFRDLLLSPNVDSVSWSLEVEIRFYLFCLLIAPCLRLGRINGVFLAAVALFGAILVADVVWTPAKLAGWQWIGITEVVRFDGPLILFILIGTVLNFHLRKCVTTLQSCLVIAGIFALLGVLWDRPEVGFSFDMQNAGSYLLAVVTFVICYTARDLFGRGGILARLADISYPLYLIHAHVDNMAIGLFAGASLLTGWPAVTLGVLTVMLLAAAIHTTVERPSHQLGRSLALLVIKPV